jgi:hypothetical protein
MASPNIPQRDPESGGADQGPYTPTAGNTESYADTDRFGSTQKGETTDIAFLANPQNHVADSPWGVNAPAGGIHPPETPDIPVTEGE